MSLALDRAALVYALREGWSRSERNDLADAREAVQEVIAAYEGTISADLLDFYGDEFAALGEHDG